FARKLQVLTLRARLVRGHDDAPRAVEPRAGEAAEPRNDRRGEDAAARRIEAELDFRRDLVDVLAPRAARANGRPLEVRSRNRERSGDDEVAHGPALAVPSV